MSAPTFLRPPGNRRIAAGRTLPKGEGGCHGPGRREGSHFRLAVCGGGKRPAPVRAGTAAAAGGDKRPNTAKFHLFLFE